MVFQRLWRLIGLSKDQVISEQDTRPFTKNKNPPKISKTKNPMNVVPSYVINAKEKFFAILQKHLNSDEFAKVSSDIQSYLLLINPSNVNSRTRSLVKRIADTLKQNQNRSLIAAEEYFFRTVKTWMQLKSQESNHKGDLQKRIDYILAGIKIELTKQFGSKVKPIDDSVEIISQRIYAGVDKIISHRSRAALAKARTKKGLRNSINNGIPVNIKLTPTIKADLELIFHILDEWVDSL